MKKIQIDHMIPKSLMKDSNFLLLEANLNKTALHTDCYKLKTKINQKFLLKP
jgi:hypothetical protein